MQIRKETQGPQTIYRLRDDNLDEVLGEAVISEFKNEIRLHGIFVKPAYRGRGHGQTLMQTILSYDETKLMTLCTGLGNVPFFERFGFIVTEVGDSLISMERKV
jgi:predicted N-acetyltransferase YhbS